MRLQEFHEIMERLKECFGQKAFSAYRAERIYKFCRHLETRQFEYIVNAFIEYQRTAPLPGDFLSEMKVKGWFSQEQKDPNFTSKHGKCGHEINSMELEKFKGACVSCLQQGYLPEVSKYPYLTQFIPSELHETARFFQRHGNETLIAYARRTWKRLREVQELYGIIAKGTKSAVTADQAMKPLTNAQSPRRARPGV